MPPNHSHTRDPSHGPHNSPASLFVPGYPSMDQSLPHHCHSHLSSSLSPGASRSQSPGPVSPLLPWPLCRGSGEEEPSASCGRQTHGAVRTGGRVERGNALRPRTHFIPSHLYWISQISGLRELVYPIKLHCKGRLCPASLPGAMGCSVGQSGGPGWEGTARGTGSLHITTASPKLSSHRGAPGTSGGCRWGPT